jgi:hypothetical protein
MNASGRSTAGRVVVASLDFIKDAAGGRGMVGSASGKSVIGKEGGADGGEAGVNSNANCRWVEGLGWFVLIEQHSTSVMEVLRPECRN